MSADFASAFESQGDRVRLRAESTDCLAVFRLVDDLRVGTIEIRAAGGTTVIERLCIDQEFRSYGAGSEAAWLLVEAARSTGVAQLRAWAHPNLGLSVYFWTRMGFSPKHGEGPEGGIWFERVV